MTNPDEDLPDLVELRRLRADVPGLSARTRAQIYARATVSAPAAPSRARRRGRVLVVVAAAVLIVVGVGIAGLVGPTPSSTAAAAVLERAAVAAESQPALDVDAGPWIHRQITRLNGPASVQVEQWESVDGSAPGRQVVTEDGVTTTTTTTTDDTSLTTAPATRLLQLPTDPDDLLAAVRQDPATRSDVELNGTDPDVAAWEVIRVLAERAPVQVQPALFRAAAGLAGLQVTDGVLDATGRSGTALSVLDPRLGVVQLVFDGTDGQFLGERILSQDGGRTQFASSVTGTSVVDALGERPAD